MSRNVDVSQLLLDPDFVDPVIHIARIPQVNSKGQNILTSQEIKTVGCVQPASGRTINRLPEALRVANVSEFWLKGLIAASQPGKYPDVLVFNGFRYQVQMVFDWTQWGGGWCEGACIAQVPA